eukprot:ANDGO_04929.mRNA.1 hypothetical protein
MSGISDALHYAQTRDVQTENLEAFARQRDVHQHRKQESALRDALDWTANTFVDLQSAEEWVGRFNRLQEWRSLSHQFLGRTEMEWLSWIDDLQVALTVLLHQSFAQLNVVVLNLKQALVKTCAYAVCEITSTRLWTKRIQCVSELGLDVRDLSTFEIVAFDRDAQQRDLQNRVIHLYEESIHWCGSFFQGGWELWMDYLQFSMTLFANDPSPARGVAGEWSQRDSVLSLLFRIASIPLHGADNANFDTTESTQDAECQFLSAVLEDHLDTHYKDVVSTEDREACIRSFSSVMESTFALKRKRRRFERNIREYAALSKNLEADETVAGWFATLCRTERDTKNWDRLKTVMERAVSVCPRVPSLWMLYVNSLAASVKEHSPALLAEAISVSTRSILFCCGEMDLWVSRLRLMEELTRSADVEEHLQTCLQCLQSAIECYASNPKPLLKLFEEFSSLLCRVRLRCIASNDHASVSRVANAALYLFRLALTQFVEPDPPVDVECRTTFRIGRDILQLFGCDLHVLSDLIDHYCIRHQHFRFVDDAGFWLSYAEMLSTSSHYDASQQVLKRGLFSVFGSEDAHRLSAAWLESAQRALVDPLEIIHQQQIVSDRLQQITNMKRKRDRERIGDADDVLGKKQRRTDPAPEVEQLAAVENGGRDPVHEAHWTELVETDTLFISNLPEVVADDDICRILGYLKSDIQEIRIVRDRFKPHFPCRGFAYVQMKTPKDASVATRKFHKKIYNGRQVYIRLSNEPLKVVVPPPSAVHDARQE